MCFSVSNRDQDLESRRPWGGGGKPSTLDVGGFRFLAIWRCDASYDAVTRHYDTRRDVSHGVHCMRHHVMVWLQSRYTWCVIIVRHTKDPIFLSIPLSEAVRVSGRWFGKKFHMELSVDLVLPSLWWFSQKMCFHGKMMIRICNDTGRDTKKSLISEPPQNKSSMGTIDEGSMGSTDKKLARNITKCKAISKDTVFTKDGW